jgi:hypothetical protein
MRDAGITLPGNGAQVRDVPLTVHWGRVDDHARPGWPGLRLTAAEAGQQLCEVAVAHSPSTAR